MNITDYLKANLHGRSVGTLAKQIRDLGHTAPGESTLEHWHSGKPLRQLPRREAIEGLAAVMRARPEEIEGIFLETIGRKVETKDAVIFKLLPPGIEHLDKRPDLLKTIVDVASYAVAQAIADEEARATEPSPPAAKRATRKAPPLGTSRMTAVSKTPAQRRRRPNT